MGKECLRLRADLKSFSLFSRGKINCALGLHARTIPQKTEGFVLTQISRIQLLLVVTGGQHSRESCQNPLQY